MPRKNQPIIHLAADHAGLKLKNAVKDVLVRAGYHVHDNGAFTNEPGDDYPDFVIPAAAAVAASRGGAVGIVFGGSGNGECIAANKVRGVRAALVYDRYSAKMSRLHNDANVMSLGGRTMTAKVAILLVKLWLGTSFSGDKRHVRRLRKITAFEKSV